MLRHFFGFLCCVFIFFFAQSVNSDELKRNLFVLGVQIGGAECVASLFESFSTSEKPGAFDLIKRNVSWSLETSRAMGNPSNSLARLKADLDKLNFAQIRQRLTDIIVVEQASWATLSTQASGIFVLGIHLEGADCVASHVRSFRREEKPGSVDLIRRNVGWIKDEVRKINMKLNTALPDTLYNDVNKSDVSFLTLYNQLSHLREIWQSELLGQTPF